VSTTHPLPRSASEGPVFTLSQTGSLRELVALIWTRLSAILLHRCRGKLPIEPLRARGAITTGSRYAYDTSSTAPNKADRAQGLPLLSRTRAYRAILSSLWSYVRWPFTYGLGRWPDYFPEFLRLFPQRVQGEPLSRAWLASEQTFSPRFTLDTPNAQPEEIRVPGILPLYAPPMIRRRPGDPEQMRQVLSLMEKWDNRETLERALQLRTIDNYARVLTEVHPFLPISEVLGVILRSYTGNGTKYSLQSIAAQLRDIDDHLIPRALDEMMLPPYSLVDLSWEFRDSRGDIIVLDYGYGTLGYTIDFFHHPTSGERISHARHRLDLRVTPTEKLHEMLLPHLNSSPASSRLQSTDTH